MVSIGLIGYGGMGRVHHRTYGKIDGAQVTAICDLTADFSKLDAGAPKINIETRGSGSSDTAGITCYRMIDEMLAAGGFDAVDICLPTYLHAEAAVKAMEAGYHAITEKPMALDVDSTKRMIEASRRTGKILSVAQCLRFWPAYVEVKRYIDEATYGKIRYASMSRYSGPPRWSFENWMLDEKRSGGSILDLHIHDTDMALFLFGKPSAVVSSGCETGRGIEHVDTLFRYPDVVVHASGGWSASSSYGFKMQAFFVFERATVELDFTLPGGVVVHPEGGERVEPTLRSYDGYFYELVDFIDGIEKGKLSGTVTSESAACSVALCLAEARSVRERREITID